MEVKKAIKKVIALGAGATLVGATIMGAMAATLDAYPEPFVKDGKFDAYIVVGDNAAASDVIGSVDIATSLQYSMKTTKVVSSGGSTTATVEGDSALLAKGSDPLNAGYDQLNGPVSVVDKTDLNALASGSISNDKGTYSYDQFVDVASEANVTFEVDSNQNDDPLMYLKFKDAGIMYTYRLSFPSAIKSDIDSSGDFDDLDNKKLTVLGKEYSIIDTDNTTGTISLMGGAVSDTIQEGETKTYTIAGKDYEVENVVVTDTGTIYTQLKINGEVTDKMQEAGTYKLSDATEIGIKSILPNEAGDVTGDIVEFYLGAQKVSFVDAKFTDDSAVGTLEIGGTTVTDVSTRVTGTYPSGDVTISKIEVYWNASDDYYVPVGGKLSDRLTGEDKEKLFLQNIDYEFAGIDKGTVEEIQVNPSSTSKYKLKMSTKTGGDINDVLFFSNTTGDVVMGYSTSKLLEVTDGNSINKNYFFITEANKYSHLLQLLSFDVTNTKVKIKDVGLGTTFEVTAANATATAFYLDGYEFQLAPDYTAKSMTLTAIAVDTSDTQADMWTPGEGKVTLGTYDNDATDGIRGNITFTEDENGHQDSTGVINWIQILLKDADNSSTTDSNKMTAVEPTSDTVVLGSAFMTSLDSDSYTKHGYTSYGTFVDFNDPSGGQAKVKLEYPSQEAEFKVYMSSGTTTTAEGSASGDITTDEIVAIDVGAAVLASQIEGDEKKHNLILVGGPCANAAARVIMGVTEENCAEGFEAGKGKVKLYENDGKVAMLVAGYSADDTRLTAQVAAKYGTYFKDQAVAELEVSGTSIDTAVVAEPVADAGTD